MRSTNVALALPANAEKALAYLNVARRAAGAALAGAYGWQRVGETLLGREAPATAQAVALLEAVGEVVCAWPVPAGQEAGHTLAAMSGAGSRLEGPMLHGVGESLRAAAWATKLALGHPDQAENPRIVLWRAHQLVRHARQLGHTTVADTLARELPALAPHER